MKRLIIRTLIVIATILLIILVVAVLKFNLSDGDIYIQNKDGEYVPANTIDRPISQNNINTNNKISSTASDGNLPSYIVPPPPVSMIDDQKTLEGIDSNGNGVRDIIELTIYLKLQYSEDSTAQAVADYNRLLDGIRKIQPKKSSKAESIDEHAFYCQYTQLSPNAKKVLPYALLLQMVTDTTDRKFAYSKALKNVPTSAGEEKCD